jgi:hydrogenase nickel incorporation protein HypA/HybF
MRERNAWDTLLKEVLRLTRERGARQVERIVLHVGALSGVEPIRLADLFPFISAGTAAEGAELIIETLPVRVRCSACGSETEARPNHLACPVCGNADTQLLSGDELQLVEIELRRPEPAAALH